MDVRREFEGKGLRRKREQPAKSQLFFHWSFSSQIGGGTVLLSGFQVVANLVRI